MPTRNRSKLWFLLQVFIILMLIAGCGGAEEDITPTLEVQPAVDTPDPNAPVGTPEPAIKAVAPVTLQIEAELKPSIDPVCLEAVTNFSLRSAPMPTDGLEPGVSHMFCAVGAPAGAQVEFALVDPDENEDVIEVTSFAQDGVTVAPYSLVLSANDNPGDWTLRATYEGIESEIDFTVIDPTRPFIALNEPVFENDEVINAGIGGLAPGSTARFALYSLTDPRSATGEANQNDGVLLISTRLVADDFGRADLELDIEDLPSGPYMLVLLPPGVDLGNPAVLKLPDQENLMVTTNLVRTAVAAVRPESGSEAESVEAPATSGGLPVPQFVAAAGTIPEALAVSLPSMELSPCPETEAPTVSIEPQDGEIGTWWRGCVGGYASGESIRIEVKMANGETAIFNVTAGLNGNAPFRWYGAPAEGSGETAVTVRGEAGSANTSWNISPATRPHVMVFPLDLQSNIGGDLYLSGFPARSEVEMALYSLDAAGLGEKIKQWQVTANAEGNYSKPFEQVQGLEAGRYVVIAQGGPTYAFPGLDTPASALAFFSYDVPPAPGAEYYSLYVGRVGEAIAAAQPTPEPVEEAQEPKPTAEPEEAPTAEATAVEVAQEPTPQPVEEATEIPPGEAPAEIPPATYVLADAGSSTITCPDATPGEPSICMLPTTIPRGSFGYMVMHDFKPNTKFTINVTAPNGKRTRMNRRANKDGYADAYWYALHNERLGEYSITIKGGGETFKDNFTIVEPSTPGVVAQNRTNKPGSRVMVSAAGFDPNEKLLLARYRSSDSADGEMNFEFMEANELETGSGGGAQRRYGTNRGQRGDTFLILVYRFGETEPSARVLYSVNTPLYLSYPYAWAQNYLEAQ